MKTHTVIPSPLGNITLAREGDALTGLWFEGQKRYGAGGLGERGQDAPVFREAREWLNEYFSGLRPDPARIRLRLEGSGLDMAVFSALRRLKYGETVSYRELAAMCGREGAFRAVGSAVGRNPVSIIIPCHRVVGADGALRGYAGGVWRKRRLLALEGADVEDI